MKLLTFSATLLLVLPVAAHELTSPFYVPEAGHLLSKTEVNYTKIKALGRRYQRFVKENIAVGLGKGWAALMNGRLNWMKQKGEGSFPRTKEYGAGVQYLIEKDSFRVIGSALYHQTTNVDLEPRRRMGAQLYVGKELKTMTPYVHFLGEFPLNAKEDVNAPVYQGEAGVFQKINASMTLDSALFLQYDKNIKERAYGVQAEWSYLMTPWSSIGLNGRWQARGKAKNHNKTYHQSVGLSVRVGF